MVAHHLERAAIELHFALADLSIKGAAAPSPGEAEESKALLAALRFALFELEWVRRRLDQGEAEGLREATPPGGVSPERFC